MERYLVEIRVDYKYLEVECSGDTPAMLADKIREVVRKFFKEDYNL